MPIYSFCIGMYRLSRIVPFYFHLKPSAISCSISLLPVHPAYKHPIIKSRSGDTSNL